VLQREVWSAILSQVRRKKRLLRQYEITATMKHWLNWVFTLRDWKGRTRATAETWFTAHDRVTGKEYVYVRGENRDRNWRGSYRVDAKDVGKLTDILAAICLGGVWHPKVEMSGDYRLITMDEEGLFVEGKPTDYA